MNGFRRDFDWQMSYLDPVRRIVGPHLLEPAPLDVDMREATDMLVLRARDMRVACRIRRTGFAERYPWEFTLRSRRATGAVTEMSKIIEGWGDWLFYGHAEHNELPVLARWLLVDLASWRAHLIRDGLRKNKRIQWGERDNRDGTHFAWFDVRSFPPSPPILIDSNPSIASPPVAQLALFSEAAE